MPLQAGMHCCNLATLSRAPLCPCSRSPYFAKRVKLTFSSRKVDINLVDGISRGIYWVPRCILDNHRVIMAVAQAEPGNLDEGTTKEVGGSAFL